MQEKFRKQMRDTFIKGNEFYAGQKPNGTIARILKDHTWSDKYQKVVPHKGRYALLFQDPGGGGQVIAFAPEQLEKALSDLIQQGYEQLTPKTTFHKPASGGGELIDGGDKEPWQIPRTLWVKRQYEKSPQKGEVIKRLLEKSHDEAVKMALVNDDPIPEEVLSDSRHLVEQEILRLAARHNVSFTDTEKAVKAGIEGWKRIKSLVFEAARTSARAKIIPEPKHQPRPSKVAKPKSKPLPPDAQNVQELSFNSDQFTCYGKPTGRGFRAYCRRK